jgi:hypothetical protein
VSVAGDVDRSRLDAVEAAGAATDAAADGAAADAEDEEEDEDEAAEDDDAAAEGEAFAAAVFDSSGIRKTRMSTSFAVDETLDGPFFPAFFFFGAGLNYTCIHKSEAHTHIRIKR